MASYKTSVRSIKNKFKLTDEMLVSGNSRFLSMYMNGRVFDSIDNKINEIKSVITQQRVLTDAAQQLIDISQDYVPLKDLYPLRKRAFTRRTKDGKKRRYKTAKESPILDEYYAEQFGKDSPEANLVEHRDGTPFLKSMYDATRQEIDQLRDESNERIRKQLRAEDEVYKKENEATYRDMRDKFKFRSLLKRNRQDKKQYKKEFKTKLKLTKIADRTVRKIIYNTRTHALRSEFENTPRMTYLKQKSLMIKKKYNSTERDYAPREPHLNESSYIVAQQGGAVGIRYIVRKKSDYRFLNNSKSDLQEYGALQYWSYDADWKRSAPKTAGRWLEQSIGIDVGGGYKKINTNTKANYEQVVKAYKLALKQRLKKQ